MKNNRNYFAIDETNCPSKKCWDYGKIPDGSDVEDYFWFKYYKWNPKVRGSQILTGMLASQKWKIKALEHL